MLIDARAADGIAGGTELRRCVEERTHRTALAMVLAVVWTGVVGTSIMMSMPSSSFTPRADRRRFVSTEQEAFLSLWRTYDRLRMLEDECFSQFELTAQQYNVLRILQAAYPQALPTLVLAERLISRAPDITRIVDRLAERRLVERQRDATNRRVVPIAITAAGSALLEEIAAPLRECHTRQLGHLSAADLEQLIRLLRAARQPHEPPESPWA